MTSKSGATPAWHGRFATRIERISPKGRLIAISDIHGRADLLDGLLKKLELREGDLLVVAGDIIERGPESLKALRRVMQLCRSGQAIALMGNIDAHRAYAMITDTDEMDSELYRSVKLWNASIFMDMCRELGLPFETREQVCAAKPLVQRAFAEELEFIISMPTILDTPGWTLVHGGLPRADFQALEGGEAFECMKFDDFLHRGPACAKPTVVGHYPVDLYWEGPVRLDPYWCAEKNVLTIDGGCGLREEAQINAAFLAPDGSFTSIYEDGLPTLTALERQQEREPTVRFCWPHGGARLIEQRALSAVVEHAESGRRCVVPIAFLGEGKEGEIQHLNDISDAALAVEPGDRLSFIARTEDGLYVKKNGVSGWYYGATEEN